MPRKHNNKRDGYQERATLSTHRWTEITPASEERLKKEAAEQHIRDAHAQSLGKVTTEKSENHKPRTAINRPTVKNRPQRLEKSDKLRNAPKFVLGRAVLNREAILESVSPFEGAGLQVNVFNSCLRYSSSTEKEALDEILARFQESPDYNNDVSNNPIVMQLGDYSIKSGFVNRRIHLPTPLIKNEVEPLFVAMGDANVPPYVRENEYLITVGRVPYADSQMARGITRGLGEHPTRVVLGPLEVIDPMMSN